MNESMHVSNAATHVSYISAIPMERMEDDSGVWTASRNLKSDDTYEAGGRVVIYIFSRACSLDFKPHLK